MNPFPHIAPDIVREVLPRREALKLAGRGAVGLALASVPSFLIAERALAATGQMVHGVLNFALTLEYLEESFYRQGLAAGGLIPSDDRAVFDQIQKHESAHVQFLRQAITGIGEQPVTLADTDFDFTAGGTFPAFTDYATFMALAQGFEDTGVRAYKGQAPALYSNGMRTNPVLTAALQIHSVEARHASEVRRMRGQKGWVEGSGTQGLPAAFAAIYAGEEATTQAGVNIASNSGLSAAAASASFDEPLTRDAVVAIADPFVIPPLM